MTARVGAIFHPTRQRTMVKLVLSGPTEGRAASIAFATRVCAGAIFIAFGAGKFLNHGSELASFQAYGLPSPDLFVSAIGALELVGGVALILGVGTRLAAVVLAGDMVARSSFRGSRAERSSA